MGFAPRVTVAAALLLPALAFADDPPQSASPTTTSPTIPAPVSLPAPPLASAADDALIDPESLGDEPRPHSRTTARRQAHRDDAQPKLIAPAALQSAPPPAAPGLTLPEGNVLLALTVESGVGAGKMFTPFSFAPDLSYGVTSDLTLSVVHSYAATTGFRGSSGAGLCMGAVTGCRALYNDVGVEGLYTLMRGKFQLAANTGALATSIDPWHTDVKLGAKAKVGAGRVYMLVSPSVWYALDDRDNSAAPHRHMLWVPVSAWVKPTRTFACGVASGIKGPLLDLRGSYAIPLGASAQATIEKGVSLGTSFVFGKVWGGSEVMDLGLDARSVHVWLSVQRDAAPPPVHAHH